MRHSPLLAHRVYRSLAGGGVASTHHSGRGWVLLLSAGLPLDAWAIPSPDLLINLSASAAQVLGLLTVLFGGFAYSLRRKLGIGAERRHGDRRSIARWMFWIMLGVLCLSLLANLAQFTWNKDDANRRLHTNLVRSSKEQGKTVVDISLKELPFSEQLRHPRGVTTEGLQHWMEEGRPLNLIDVREPEEVEMGRVHGSWPLRYPDLRRDPGLMQGKPAETVLLCYSGNRSGELCDEFTKEGLACRFLIGGYEKWVTEHRPLELSAARRPEDLRDIRDYPNKTALLDTPEVLRLVQQEHAVFVDVRYPEDFKREHLPGAHNVTVRKLASDEVTARLKELPHQPIIAPCYDKRSCFYALILGSRLHRLGYDFRGRYTVPQEFYLLPAAKGVPAEEEVTLLASLAWPLQVSLQALSDGTGHLAAGLLVWVLVFRLLFLPVMLKAERDQQAQRALAPEVAVLKEKYQHDPQSLSHALQSLHQKAGIAPARNLLGSLLQLALFLVLFVAVDHAAQGVQQGFLWVPALGSRDPTYALPAAVGLLTAAYLVVVGGRRAPLWLVLYTLAGTLLFLLTRELKAAVNLYLALNLSALLVQGIAAKHLHAGSMARALRRWGTVRGSRNVVALKDANRRERTGNKARRLAQMMEAGLPVPDGFVITAAVWNRGGDNATGESVLCAADRRAVERLWQRLGAEAVAVRSSGDSEDGAAQSYAGVFESVLNVRHEGLYQALEQVRASLGSARAAVYSGNTAQCGGIVVQKMVDAEYAGVLFTEHPASTACMLVEVVPGLGERLVSGTATPEAYRFGRLSADPLDGRDAPIDLQPLLALARKVEALFGKPQDIEWAFAAGRFWLTQSRDITAPVRKSSASRGALERERYRLLEIARGAKPNEVVFYQNGLSELLPRPTPLSLSLMEALWALGGSTDRACRLLGVPYRVGAGAPPYVTTVFGALYVNRREEQRRLQQAPSAFASFRLSRAADRIERELREDFLPRFLQEVRLAEALDVYRLSLEELVALARQRVHRFVTQTYVQAEIINVAADFYWKSAVRVLRREGMDPSLYLGKAPPTVVQQAMNLLVEAKNGRREASEFLDLFGHRAPLDYELAQPRYRENAQLVQGLLARSAGTGTHAEPVPELQAHRLLGLAVGRAHRFEVLKEEAKHHCLRELADLRRLLLALDTRLDLDGGIFYLTLDEVMVLSESFRDHALDLIDRRRREAEALSAVELPSQLSLGDLERFDGADTIVVPAEQTGVLRGIRVSGDGEVTGRVRIVRGPEEVEGFQKGEILVARFTDPAWTPMFPLAKGVVTEVGGWLSHAAIVAREYDLPAILGVPGVMGALETGQLVRLREDGMVEKVADRRRHRRVPLTARVALTRHGELVDAILRDLSRSGALIEIGQNLDDGESVAVQISAEGGEVRAQVVRHDSSGGYGLRFATPLEELPPAETLRAVPPIPLAPLPAGLVPGTATAKARAQLVLSVLRGEATLDELGERHAVPPEQIRLWMDEACAAIERALESPALDAGDRQTVSAA